MEVAREDASFLARPHLFSHLFFAGPVRRNEGILEYEDLHDGRSRQIHLQQDRHR